MSLVFDAGALVAVERADRRVPVTHGGVVGQVWRGGAGRQANLARLLPGLEIVGVDEALGKRAGVLLARARTRDVIDAALVLLAADEDWLLTSDPGDLEVLAAAAGLHVEIVPV
jgi:hypothetical protein